MILVSHRPSLLALADHTYDLTDGRLVRRETKPADAAPSKQGQVVEMPRGEGGASDSQGAQAS